MPIPLDKALRHVGDFVALEQRKRERRQRRLRVEFMLDDDDQLIGVYFKPGQPQEVRIA